MKLPIKPLSQRDARWRYKKLGTSDVTIGKYGCLLTCHSMSFALDGVQQTPDVLNETYKNNNVYHNQNLIHFWSIPNVFPDIRAEEFDNYYDDPAPVDKFYKWLDMGLPVIVLVDFDCNPADGVDMHFVVLHGYDDSTRDFFCVDPWTGEEYYFKAKYGDPVKYIYGHRFYSWEVQHEPSCEEKIEKLEKTLHDRDEQIARLSQEVGYYTEELKKQEDDNAQLAKEVSQERNKRLEAVSEQKRLQAEIEKLDKDHQETVETLKNKVSKLEGDIDTLQEEQKALRIRLKASASLSCEQRTSFELIKILVNRLLPGGGDNNGEEES